MKQDKRKQRASEKWKSEMNRRGRFVRLKHVAGDPALSILISHRPCITPPVQQARQHVLDLTTPSSACSPCAVLEPPINPKVIERLSICQYVLVPQ